MSIRTDRGRDELRPIKIERHFTKTAAGSVLISAGNTVVLCTASLVDKVPLWKDPSSGGWLTAEYRMLPGSTLPRTARADRPDGRATEIQRLIGRSLRAIIDLQALGPRTIYLDCDVLQADGGTRTLSITGSFIALKDALTTIKDQLADTERFGLLDTVAAVSVGIVDGEPLLDLCYEEDSAAEVDMNVVMTGRGQFIEVQGTGEKSVFSRSELNELLDLGEKGIRELMALQAQAFQR